MDDRLIYLNAFNLLPNIGSATLFKIDKEFSGNFESAWKMATAKFQKFQLDQDQITSLDDRKSIDPEKEFKKLEKEKIALITWHDESYPDKLKEIPGPPFLLYIRGVLPKDEQIKIAVVGTRLLTEYGKRVTPVISHELTTAGAIIISGLATGIDTLAHKACLDASGITVAVIGSGLDQKSFFPQQNYNLSLKIAERGAVISEYPLGMSATKEKFPARNRIVSGLSNGVLVVEADQKSGALITARLALEQNRDVFAIPGGIFWPKSR
ncbi:MAG: DNA-protecting protein DprA, partial [Parcubacteria group bacterium]|nr:DNA-protecting protein DprA [Parcubacteria group bacterium]